MEAAWATALGHIDGISRPLPLIVFITALILSMCGLGYAMKSIPIGTAYAIWTGIGAAATIVIGVCYGTETLSPVKILLLTGLLACIVGLKFVSK